MGYSSRKHDAKDVMYNQSFVELERNLPVRLSRIMLSQSRNAKRVLTPNPPKERIPTTKTVIEPLVFERLALYSIGE